LLDVQLHDTVNFELKKIPRTLYSQFLRKRRNPDIKYTGTI